MFPNQKYDPETLDITFIRVICTEKKENQIFLIYKEIQNGAVAKSYMRKGFPIYEEMRKYLTIYRMRRPLVIQGARGIDARL
jgi:hypothetical protein